MHIMNPGNKSFAVCVWIACLAILMAALAPGVSHLVQAAYGQAQQQAMPCHVHDGGAERGHHGGHAGHGIVHALDDCGYCAMQVDLPLLPPQPVRTDGLLEAARFVPVLFLSAPKPLFAWLGAQPRAPPAI